MTFDGFISYSHAADGRLAPALQHGLHRLAKPWHRRRALWIFRDQTGLSVTPALWSSIQQALDDSEWFVLLASPEAARSPWVNREIKHWIATKPADRILPVVTDGKWQWDAERGDMAADSTAVPDALRGVFAEEPLFLDLRWAHDDAHLSLQHARFREAIAQLAAPMHGVSKDDLEGEDVRQHRRVRRLRRAAVAALTVLTVAASLIGVVADRNADRATASAVEARRQQQVAAQQRGNAERAAEETRRQEQIAAEQRGNAGRAADEAQRQKENARKQKARARTAAAETKRQEKRARQQQAVAKRAAADARRQQDNARRQRQLARRAQALAEEQKAVAREQSKLARQSVKETTRQRIIAEKQQRLAAEAAAETERQKHVARQQQRLAEAAEEEARRQERIARENERKAKEAAEEARKHEKNAAEQQQVAIGRKLFNRAEATISNDPATALKLGIAAQKIRPGTEVRGDLAGLVASTRLVGIANDVEYVGYGPNDVLAVVHSDRTASMWSVANRATPVLLGPLGSGSFLGEPVFSPDGKTLTVISGRDYEPLLFDVSDPARATSLGTVPAQDTAWLTISPDGKTLAAVTILGEWTLWDLTDRRNPALLTRQKMKYASAITFGPDSRTVVTAGAPGTVWDVTDRKRPTEVGTLDGNWRVFTFSPTRPLLAASDENGNLALWHMNDRTKPRKVATELGRGYAATFSSDGRTLATSEGNGTTRLWDISENTPVHLANVDDHGGYGVSLAFSPDGRTLATAGSSGTLYLWTVAAHGEPKTLGRAEGDPQHGLVAALTSDGQRLTTAYFGGTATVWKVSDPTGPEERATIRIHPANLHSAAVSPRGDTIAALGWATDGTVTLTDIRDPGKPVPLGTLPGRDYERALAFGPDGRMLAVGKGSHVTLWDLADRQRPTLLADFRVNDLAMGIAFSPDGQTIAIASSSRTVGLWSVADRSNPIHLGTLKGHSNQVLAMAFSPDGRTLATGGQDKTAALWNIADKTRPRRHTILTGNGHAVWSVAFAPDGRTLATGTADDTAALWDVTEMSAPVRVATLRGASAKSASLLFHPDGRTLTTSGTSYSRTRAVLWDYSTLNSLRANPADVACAITGGGFSREEWAAYIPEMPYRPTCTR